MIITNIKIFNKVCNEMKRFCKSDDDKPYNNMFFVDKNLMCSTNGKIMAVRNVSDCVLNMESFGFPFNTKPIKIVTSNGDKLIIENRKEEWFNNKKKEYLKDFNWKRILPYDLNGNKLKPSAEKEYDFSDYDIFNIKSEKYSKVIFKCNDIIFRYEDYYDTVATYGDVVVSKENNILNNDTNDEIKEVMFPMNQIMNILKIDKHFILRQFDKYKPNVIVTKDYMFVLNECVC